MYENDILQHQYFYTVLPYDIRKHMVSSYVICEIYSRLCLLNQFSVCLNKFVWCFVSKEFSKMLIIGEESFILPGCFAS